METGSPEKYKEFTSHRNKVDTIRYDMFIQKDDVQTRERLGEAITLFHELTRTDRTDTNWHELTLKYT